MSVFLLALAKWIIILILLVYQPRRNFGNLLLAGGLLMMSLFDLNYYLSISAASTYLTAIFYLYSSPWVTLIGPFFYLYIRNTLADRNRLYWMDLLHTIPFWLMWINHIPYFALPFDQKLAFAPDAVLRAFTSTLFRKFRVLVLSALYNAYGVLADPEDRLPEI